MGDPVQICDEYKDIRKRYWEIWERHRNIGSWRSPKDIGGQKRGCTGRSGMVDSEQM
jgi:hypothetical protein